MSRIASLKEFAFMKALHKHGFPTPIPLEANRHGIVMNLIRAYPMGQVKGLTSAEATYNECIGNIIKLAEHGLVHGDFNEFNLMISEEEDVTVIDFPQMVSTTHLNAQFYFERDVKCIQAFFGKRFGLQFEGVPVLENDIDKKFDVDKEVKASGHLN
jgi:RIO kinase 2